MAKHAKKKIDLGSEPPNETQEEVAAAIGASLAYLGQEAVEAGLIEVAHLIGVAAGAAFQSADHQRRRSQ